MKKIKISSELTYVLATVLIAFSVAMISSTDFGFSMIVAPAYILSCKLDFLTFGQSEFVLQGIMFVIFCILMKRVRLIYFFSFFSGVIYGAVLDFWRLVIPHFNPDVTAPGSLPVWLRIIYFVVGTLITAIAVALYFRTYLYPQVYDFFVKGVSEKYNLNRTKFKIGYDMFMLILSCVMTFCMFGKLVGVGIGSIITACCNGFIIGFLGKMIDKFFVIEPRFKKFSTYFEV